MAIEVTSWSEFLEAAGGNDPTLEINLPENAEWDLGEIEPEGHTGYIKLVGQINGNGTKIKNLVIQNAADTINGVFQVDGTVTDLHFVDGVWISSAYIVRILTNNSIVQLCTFSASIQGGGGTVFYFDYTGTYKGIVYRCAVNLEIASGTNITIQGGNVEGKYNNFKISGSRLQTVVITVLNGTYRNGKLEYSSVTLDTPAVTSLAGASLWWSLLRCNGANVGDLRSVGDGGGERITLACSTDFPNATQFSQGLRMCTENELRDAAYLQSIGFPIGV